MSKFHLNQELTNLISNAVQAFALRIETEHRISKDVILSIWDKCSEDIVSTKKKTGAATKKSTDADKQKQELQTVQRLVKSEVPERRFALRKNKYGNYEHTDTSFIFDPATKEVCGKQVGEIVKSLRISDIELCKQYGFKFKMPEMFEDEPEEEKEHVDSDIDELGLMDDEPEDDE